MSWMALEFRISEEEWEVFMPHWHLTKSSDFSEILRYEAVCQLVFGHYGTTARQYGISIIHILRESVNLRKIRPKFAQKFLFEGTF